MERVVAARKEHLGESHPETIVSILNLSSFLRRVGEFARASELIESALRLHDEGGGRGDERTVFTLESIAAHLYGVGRYEEALARYDEALALARELFPEAHPMRAWSAACRGGALMRLGRFDEAEAALRPTYEVCVERLGPKHQVTCNALRLLAELARARGNVEEAELACSELLSLEGALNPFERFDALTLRAQARTDLERFDGARADLEAAADALDAPEAPRWWRAQLLFAAERLFTAWQRPDELERFRARLAP
jgi:tetratricopeptide (TPR) repeat protein